MGLDDYDLPAPFSSLSDEIDALFDFDAFESSISNPAQNSGNSQNVEASNPNTTQQAWQTGLPQPVLTTLMEDDTSPEIREVPARAQLAAEAQLDERNRRWFSPAVETGYASGEAPSHGTTQQYNPFLQNFNVVDPIDSGSNMLEVLASAENGGEISQPQQPDGVKRKRTRITRAAKKTLNEVFEVDPYPDDGQMSRLLQATRLTRDAIKNWFNNTRARKGKTAGRFSSPCEHRNQSAVQSHDRPPLEATGGTPLAVHTEGITRASLDILNRVSPAESMTSLDRYLATPADQDAIPASLAGVAMQFNNTNGTTIAAHYYHTYGTARRLSGSTLSIDWFDLQNRFEQPSSVTGSDVTYAMSAAGSYRTRYGSISARGSIGSDRSVRSARSIRTADSRAPRQGIRQWTQQVDERGGSARPLSRMSVSRTTHLRASEYTPLSSSRPRYTENGIPSETSSPGRVPTDVHPMAEHEPTSEYTNQIYCTWPACNATFRYKSDWARHEEAKHYQPYHWICCLDEADFKTMSQCFICGDRDVLFSHFGQSHCSGCVAKDGKPRVFYREDQLAQHIRRSHLGFNSGSLRVPKYLLSAWKTINMVIEPSALRCGFCGEVFDTWTRRQDHVLAHIQDGAPKKLWMSDIINKHKYKPDE